MSYNRTELTNPPEYRWIRTDKEMLAPVMLAADNAAGAIFGTLNPGVVLGQQADGRVRPAGRNLLTDDVAAANVVEVDDDANFFLGDVVNVRSTLGTVDTITYDGGDNPSDITVTARGNSRIRIDQIAPNIANHPLQVLVVDDGTAITVSVQLEMDAGPNIVSTMQEVADALMGTGLFLSAVPETPADLAKVVGWKVMTGGVDAGDDIAAARNITVIPKSGTNLITVDGAAFSALQADGAYLALNGPEALPVGVLDGSKRTFRNDPSDGSQVARDKGVSMAIDGTVRKSRLIGYSDIQRLLLEGLTDFESAVPLLPGIYVNTAL